jgi:hypothetical protein
MAAPIFSARTRRSPSEEFARAERLIHQALKEFNLPDNIEALIALSQDANATSTQKQRATEAVTELRRLKRLGLSRTITRTDRSGPFSRDALLQQALLCGLAAEAASSKMATYPPRRKGAAGAAAVKRAKREEVLRLIAAARAEAPQLSKSALAQSIARKRLVKHTASTIRRLIK